MEAAGTGFRMFGTDMADHKKKMPPRKNGPESLSRLPGLFSDFFNSEKSGGLVLVCCTVISLALANSPWAAAYLGTWHTEVAGHPLEYWINDGLMAVFFLLVGLELKREIFAGRLSDLKSASLPIFAALGGMLVPAALFLAFNLGLDTRSGAGIPMATDIAFAVGILSLLGNRVPASLKVFLTALAVIDDLGAIIVIAVFYTASISFVYLAAALGILLLLSGLNRLKVSSLWPYLSGGLLAWYCMLHSGVHATVTGVLLAFVIPFGDGGKKTPSYVLQHVLHRPVAFLVMPVFALANTGIVMHEGWYRGLGSPAGMGIILGLVLGKPLGIWLFSLGTVAAGWCALPAGLSWKQLAGAGCLGGIGFTMSIFITLLAFDDPVWVDQAKTAILAASVAAGILGYLWLHLALRKDPAGS